VNTYALLGLNFFVVYESSFQFLPEDIQKQYPIFYNFPGYIPLFYALTIFILMLASLSFKVKKPSIDPKTKKPDLVQQKIN
jgi:hypothetical protein